MTTPNTIGVAIWLLNFKSPPLHAFTHSHVHAIVVCLSSYFNELASSTNTTKNDDKTFHF